MFGLHSVWAMEKICTCSSVLGGVCVSSKKSIDDSHAVALDNLFNDDARTHAETLLRNKKLVLVLDLDRTLIHARKVKDLTSGEKYLEDEGESLENISNGSLFRWKEMGFLVKLRPYVRSFLEEASNMFEMYICTMGFRGYAEKVAKLLDPDSKYFNSRIIAYEDFKQTERKNLNLVLGGESNIIILDDTESVWSDHAKNLITVSRYEYFKEREHVRSYSEEKTDESESNGALANILRVLKTVHRLVFDNPAGGEAPSFLAKTRSGILKGCTLLISDVQILTFIRLWAESMGATCTTLMDSSITHVVSLYTGTENCRWAEQEKKFMVHPSWIEAAHFLWQRQPEVDYLPQSLENYSCGSTHKSVL